MPFTTIALSRVVELNVPLLWQEVVAVAQAAGGLAVQSGQPITLGSFGVSTSGAVTLVGASESRSALDVYGLAAALLDGQPSPSELRNLIASRERGPAGVPAPSRVLSQVEALQYFATPNPDVDIAALAARALEADADDLARGAIERLRADTAISTSPVPDGRDGPTRTAKSKAMVASAIVLTLALAIAAVARYSGVLLAPGIDGTQTADAPARAGTLVVETLSAAVQSMTSTLDAATDAALQKMGLVAASEGGVAAGPPRPTADGPRRNQARAADLALPPPPISAPAMANGMEIAPTAVFAEEGADAVESLDATKGDLDAAEFGRIYSSNDAEVAPPSLVYPQLPTLLLESGPGSAHLSLVVNELGQVVQVRLVSTGATVSARMLVFAAKTWKFSPATMDGRSVKYHLRIPLGP
jgi:hypothetical protein